jgi:methionyl-tRNA formyltransferase
MAQNRVKIFCCGYRSWAVAAFQEIRKQRPTVEIVILLDWKSVTRQLLDVVQPTFLLFYGWSWLVESSITSSYPCYCLHPSALPAYRGGSPLQHQIIAGLTETKATLFLMTKDFDRGPIAAAVSLSLEGDIPTIQERMTSAGVKLGTELIDTYESGNVPQVKEQEGAGSIYKRRTPAESEITQEELLSHSAFELANKIRSLTGDYPHAFIKCRDGTRLEITQAAAVQLEKL